MSTTTKIVLFVIGVLACLPAVASATDIVDSGTTTALGTNWLKRDSINVSDDKRANHSNTSGLDTAYAYTMGIAFPSDGVLDSIIITVEGYGTSATAARRGVVACPTKDGSLTSWPTAQNLPGTAAANEGTVTFNGALWGTTWSESEIEAAGFGILFRNSSTSSGTIYIDQVKLRLVYHTFTANANQYMSIEVDTED